MLELMFIGLGEKSETIYCKADIDNRMKLLMKIYTLHLTIHIDKEDDSVATEYIMKNCKKVRVEIIESAWERRRQSREDRNENLEMLLHVINKYGCIIQSLRIHDIDYHDVVTSVCDVITNAKNIQSLQLPPCMIIDPNIIGAVAKSSLGDLLIELSPVGKPMSVGDELLTKIEKIDAWGKII